MLYTTPPFPVIANDIICVTADKAKSEANTTNVIVTFRFFLEVFCVEVIMR